MPTYTDNVIEVMRATIEAQREKLAAANALLEQATDAVDEACYPVWWEAYRSHLSAAAPEPARRYALNFCTQCGSRLDCAGCSEP